MHSSLLLSYSSKPRHTLSPTIYIIPLPGADFFDPYWTSTFTAQSKGRKNRGEKRRKQKTKPLSLSLVILKFSLARGQDRPISVKFS